MARGSLFMIEPFRCWREPADAEPRDVRANEKWTYLVRFLVRQGRSGEIKANKSLKSLVGPAGLEPATRPL
jgi:hypothetical protein